MKPPIAVVIVAWNNLDDTRECIESIVDQQYFETRIFLVDNGSNLEPLGVLASEFPKLVYIRSDLNLGFAAGTNLGLRTALLTDSVYFLIVNNDTKADGMLLKELTLPLEHEEVGLSAPLIYYYDNPDKIWSSGGKINKFFMMPLNSHNTREKVLTPTKRTFVSGCCYLLKRELLENLGLFDERFFLYFEDLDFCKRVNETKWQMIVTPTAKLWHKVSRSSGGKYSANERYHYALSSGIYFRKHVCVENVIPVVIFRLGNAFIETIKLISRGDFKVLKSYLRGLYMGWISKSVEKG